MLLYAILRGAIGLAIIGVAVVGLFFSFVSEGVGLFGSAILFVFFVIFMIAQNYVDEATLEAFMGVDTGDYLAICIICMVGGFLFASTHIAGIGTSLAVGYSGLIVSGFLDPTQLATLSDAVLNTGIVVMLPIVLPCVILIVVVGLLVRS